MVAEVFRVLTDAADVHTDNTDAFFSDICVKNLCHL